MKCSSTTWKFFIAPASATAPLAFFNTCVNWISTTYVRIIIVLVKHRLVFKPQLM